MVRNFNVFLVTCIVLIVLIVVLLFGLPLVHVEDGTDAKAWLTLDHKSFDEGYQVRILGDIAFKVDNHFLTIDPPGLVVDIAKAQIHKNIYLEVAQPELSAIRAVNRDGRVRVVLDFPEGVAPKYELVERDHLVMIKLFEHTKKIDLPVAHPDEKISIQLFKAELADFFAIISKASGRTIKVDESIKTRISLRLVDISWVDALAQVLKLYNLEIEEQGEVWYALEKKE